jgi:hypothetical protein
LRAFGSRRQSHRVALDPQQVACDFIDGRARDKKPSDRADVLVVFANGLLDAADSNRISDRHQNIRDVIREFIHGHLAAPRIIKEFHFGQTVTTFPPGLRTTTAPLPIYLIVPFG